MKFSPLQPCGYQMCGCEKPSWEYQHASIPPRCSFKAALGLETALLSSPSTSAKVLGERKEERWRKIGRHSLLLEKRGKLFKNTANMGLQENLSWKGRKGQKRRLVRMAKRVDEQGESRKNEEKKTKTFVRLLCLSCPKTSSSSSRGWKIFRILK